MIEALDSVIAHLRSGHRQKIAARRLIDGRARNRHPLPGPVGARKVEGRAHPCAVEWADMGADRRLS